MKTEIATWGNSLAIRVPKKFLAALKLHKGSTIKINLEHNKIVIEKEEEAEFFTSIAKENMSLKELMSKVTEQNKPDLTDFETTPVGKEIW